MYFIWHCQRQGWVSKSAGTTTDVNDAQRFDRAVAVERCRKKDHEGSYVMVPVSEDDLL